MHFCIGLRNLINALVFEVGAYRNLTDEYVLSKSVAWLFDQYERVERARWRDLASNITAMETGAMRALATMFGKKGHKLPDLPTYEETIRGQEDKDFEKPAWMTKYEEVNRGRIAPERISGGEKDDDGASVL